MATAVQLGQLFPQSAAALTAPAGLWNLEVDPRSAAGVKTLYTVVLLLENQSGAIGIADLVETARCLRLDLLRLHSEATFPLAESDLHALHLAVTLGPARTGVLSGQLNVAYEWLLWSLTTTWAIDGEHMLNVGWLVSAAGSQLDDAIAQIVSPWFDTLYIYDRLAAGLPAMTDPLAPQAVALALAQVRHGEFDLAGALLGWAGTRSLDPAVARVLARICGEMASVADDSAADPTLRARALRPLALCLGSVTGQDSRVRSQQLLDEFGDTINPTDRLAALGNVYAGRPDDLADDLQIFIDLALEHHARFSEAESAAAMAWARGSKHQLLNVPLHTLLLDGRVDPAMRLLRAWRGAPDAGERPCPLVGVIADDHGVSWVAEGCALVSSEGGPGLADYQPLANAFLGSTVTVSSSPEVTVDRPARERGVPDPSAARPYLQTLELFLRLGDAKRVHTDAELRPSSLLLLPTLQAPIQALMLRSFGWTLPLTSSLEQPAPDRRIGQALLYLGGSLFSPLEEEVLTSILADSNVVATIRRDADFSRQRFLEDYQSPRYDLVWLGTHGQFDGLRPDDTYLHLTPTERVRLDDLRAPESDRRRLLVLNSCDGAVTAQTAGLGEIGAAAYAASSAQAVVSHLWPVESSTTALMFAGVLAKALMTIPNFFEAYESAVKLLSGGSTALRGHTSEYSDRLTRMLDDKPDDFDRLTSWGSAAFVQ